MLMRTCRVDLKGCNALNSDLILFPFLFVCLFKGILFGNNKKQTNHSLARMWLWLSIFNLILIQSSFSCACAYFSSALEYI